ncbi:MAG: hypothetical protein IKK34_08035 [Clostridia bacterium]|nr:hypothetical protein [Clostridia bacterium]
MSKMLDFDLFMSEKEKETITVKVYGKEYEVPAKMPAVVPLMMARAERLADQSSRNAAFVKMIFTAADALFGTKQMDDICARGMDVEQLSMLIQKVFNVINGSEEDDGEATELTDEDSRTKLPGGNGAKK